MANFDYNLQSKFRNFSEEKYNLQSKFPRQTKFDYYNSSARKNYLRKNSFSMLFWLFNAAFFVLILLSIYLFFLKSTGLSQIILAIALILESINITIKYTSSGAIDQSNLANRLTTPIIELLEKTILRAKRENLSVITIELCFDTISEVSYGRMIFTRLGLIYPPLPNEKIKNTKNPSLSPELINLFSGIPGEKEIGLNEFLTAVITNSKPIQKYLSDINITIPDTQKVLNWAEKIHKTLKDSHFWENEESLAGVGQDWSYGYTPVLSIYSTDLSMFYNDLRFQIDVFNHQNKLDEIQTILVKSGKNNCLLVGEPGVGKKTIINALALKLARGDCLEKLKYKRIRQLDVGRMLAGADPDELNRRLEVSFSEATSAGNIILYIDNFQSMLEGETNTAQILIPFLQNSKLRIIASTSKQDYFDVVRQNSSIDGAFEKIDINPPTSDETLSILLDVVGQVEYKNSVFFPITTLKKIVELADRYIHEIPFPEKSIRLLEEAAVNFASGRLKIVKPEDIESLISKKTNIPVGKIQAKEKDKLLDLESFLHKRVIGQNEAISAVSNTLRRARAGLSSGKRPAGVFLFMGPTGVGKTETAKALAESYFGSEKRMIRLDMSEYQAQNSVDRLLGTVSNPSGVLTNAITENPFSLILLDEIEKADSNILNLFLQVFEDGRLTDPRGRVCDFTNSIIIATTNAGSQFIASKVKLGEIENLKDELIEKLESDNLFSPEFLNRFDGVIVFKPLTSEELSQVANLMINDLNKTLENKKIQVVVEPAALSKLVELGYDPKFGARPMRRVIQEKLENLLAKKMLAGVVGDNQTVKINLLDIS